jgi:hypothetical protein
VKDVEDIDPLDWIADVPVENLIISVQAMAHAALLVSGKERKAQRHGRQTQALLSQLGDEGDCPHRVISADIVADGFKIGFRVR